jgi:hypothetical protein
MAKKKRNPRDATASVVSKAVEQRLRRLAWTLRREAVDLELRLQKQIFDLGERVKRLEELPAPQKLL